MKKSKKTQEQQIPEMSKDDMKEALREHAIVPEFDARVAMVASSGQWWIFRGKSNVLGPFKTETSADNALKKLKAAHKRGKLVW